MDSDHRRMEAGVNTRSGKCKGIQSQDPAHKRTKGNSRPPIPKQP
ncbi:hypothetical protein LINPERHAP1_LOCUS30372, partial [Linum perenne]